MEKIMNRLEKILLNLAGIALFGVVISVAIQIIARNFLHIPVAWTEEVARYLMIWMTFLGSPVALKKGEHLFVDLFYNKFPAKGRQWVHLLCDVAVFIFCIYLLYFGIKMCTDPKLLRFRSPSAGIRRVYIYSALPVSAAMMAVVAAYDIYLTFLTIQGKREDTTASSIVDENITLAELDQRKKEANRQ